MLLEALEDITVWKRTEGYRNMVAKAVRGRKELAQDLLDSYTHWKTTGSHPGLERFTVIPGYCKFEHAYDYRSIGAIQKGAILWFWFGSHEAYNPVFRKLGSGSSNPYKKYLTPESYNVYSEKLNINPMDQPTTTETDELTAEQLEALAQQYLAGQPVIDFGTPEEYARELGLV